MTTARRAVTAGLAAAVLAASSAAAVDDPWIIASPVVITEPTELGQVILVNGGSLTVRDVPEPGLRVAGSIWATGESSVRFERSVIRIMSVFHGQYALAGIDDARIEVVDCDYRVPAAVQHALIVAGDAEATVRDTDFGDVQLISAERASFEAARLTGNFEVIVQNDSSMALSDIPRVPGQGRIWVWVEFPPGSVADYSPPMPGLVDTWTFPPPGATGIDQTVSVNRCEALLWPMLVRQGSDLTLREVAVDNWVVVGFYLPNDVTVRGLFNGRTYADETVDLFDRSVRMIDATVDTWNLYPEASAHVTVVDSLVGEILAMGDSRVRMERTEVDGSGGFFGARDSSRIIAEDSRITCTVEASQRATVELHDSTAEPYPDDPTGAWTRFGAYDDGRILADQTGVLSTPALAGRGLIAISYVEPPTAPPATGGAVELFGSIAQFSLDPVVATGAWRLEASVGDGRPAVVIASGTAPVEEDVLGTWSDADPTHDYRLRTVLTDGLGRTLVGTVVVPGSAPRVR